MTLALPDLDGINTNVRCDMSGQIASTNFQKMKEALKKVATELDGESLEDIINNVIGGISVGEREVVQWFGAGTKHTAADGKFISGTPGGVYFRGRFGPANIGITHDPTVASPLTNGNFTVTGSGNFLVHMTAFFGPLLLGGSEGDYSVARMRLDVNRAGAGFVAATELAQVTSIVQYQMNSGIVGNEFFTASTSFIVALQAGDILRLVVTETQSGGFSNGWELTAARILFDRIGDYDEFELIP